MVVRATPPCGVRARYGSGVSASLVQVVDLTPAYTLVPLGLQLEPIRQDCA